MCLKNGPCHVRDRNYCQEYACLFHPERQYDLARMANYAVIERRESHDPPRLRLLR